MDFSFESRNNRGNAAAAGAVDVRARVIAVVCQVTKLSISEISGEKLIRDDLGVDSMQAIEALAILEKEFDIIIDPEKAFQVATMEDLFRLIEQSVHITPKVA